jgi:transcription elongation factor GreA-like protein/transcription elongation GreA/GreB family factor
MAYLKDFRERIRNNDYPGFLKIWEEYCYGDEPDGEEIVAILESVLASELARHFGPHVDRVLHTLWKGLKDQKQVYEVLRLVFDLQTTNSEQLADLATEFLKSKYAQDPLLLEKLKLVGLRNREKFQGAISNFELLTHFKKGNFVFHTAGMGTGEIIDVSMTREEVIVEFEHSVGHQTLSFEKAFKTLKVLPNDHFYSLRFGFPDALEKRARENPAEVIRLLLRDLGPKTAAEIKDECVDLIIPADDWNKWWQPTRAKLKRDTKIESPKELKEPFRLRSKEEPHEVALHRALDSKPGVQATIQLAYTHLRDHPETLKNTEFRSSLEAIMRNLLEEQQLSEPQKLQVLFFLEDLTVPKIKQQIEELVDNLLAVCDCVHAIQIMSFQKKLLQLVRKRRKDWKEIYLDLLFSVDSNLLRDFILAELNQTETEVELKKKLNSLLIHPLSYPDIFVWYFQKLIAPKSVIPFSDNEGKNDFFEGLLILLDHLEKKPQYRDLSKKILAILTANRYKVVRDIMSHSNLEEVKEYLLLATKCGSMTDHDIKILHSLGEVVHPTLSHLSKEITEDNTLWTTQQGYNEIVQRIERISTTEMISCATEINIARGHGDLKENAEYKAALERRARLLNDWKQLKDELYRARIVTPADVSVDEVGIGTVVHFTDSKGEHNHYTLLGPWDASAEKRILSFQSKLAQAMKGCAVGDTFDFQGETFTITEINNYFDQKK